MNTKALVELAKQASAWAKAYTTLKAALMAEGVQEEEAQRQAGAATMTAAERDSGEPCPLCGRGE